MSGRLILYYLALMFFVTWAGSLLVRASHALCQQAKRDYHNPNESNDNGRQDKT